MGEEAPEEQVLLWRVRKGLPLPHGLEASLRPLL